MGFLCNVIAKVKSFFIVLMFCEAEAVNICREGSNCKKKKNTLDEFKKVECNVGIRLKPWPVYKAVLRHKE